MPRAREVQAALLTLQVLSEHGPRTVAQAEQNRQVVEQQAAERAALQDREQGSPYLTEDMEAQEMMQVA